MRTPALLPWLVILSGLRWHLRHPVQLLLTMAGIALGVAVVLAIDLASHSASRSFSDTVRLLSGQATHRLYRPTGDLPDTLYRELRVDLGVESAAPIIEGRVRLSQDPERFVTLLGTDPFASSGARLGPVPSSVRPALVLALVLEPGAVLIGRPLAARLGVAVGDSLLLAGRASDYPLHVVGIIDSAGSGAPVLDAYLLADISTVQEALGRPGLLSRIELRVHDQGILQRVRRAMPADARLEEADQQALNLDTMTRAFRVNLQALSLLALLVGAFLVFSTMSFAVVRRRRIFATLRSLGVGRMQLLSMVLLEALILAVPACVAGLLFGTLLGSVLVHLVLRIVNDLYAGAAADEYQISAFLLCKGIALGVCVSVLAALLPAAEAAWAAPRDAGRRIHLEGKILRSLPIAGSVALGLALLGTGLLVGARGLALALAGLFLVVMAFAVATPLVTAALMGAMSRVAGHALALRYACRSVAASLSRTGPALAALTVAVGAYVGMAIMVASFRQSVADWLDYSFDTDVLFIVGGRTGDANPGVVDRLIAQVQALPGAAGVVLTRRSAVPDKSGLARFLAIQPDPHRGRWPLSDRPRSVVLEALRGSQAVAVSEAYARKHGLSVGDSVALATPAGPRSFKVAAVFTDYATDQGVVALDLALYRRLFADPGLSTIGVFARPGQRAQLESAAQNLADREPGLSVTTGATLRSLSLKVFDRTFTVTDVLRGIAGFVAVMALLNTLQADRLDRAREIATLRTLGLSPRQLLVLAQVQSGLMGLATAVLALPLGLTLAWLLIHVVNRIAFGWSTSFVVDLSILGQGLLVAVAATTFAAWWPSRRALMKAPAQDLREDG